MTFRRTWLPAGLAILMVGWGANQFASLLAVYRQAPHGLSELAVTAILGVYVAGLIPALLRGGRVSDQRGRKSITLVAIGISIVASLLMVGGAWITPLLFVGRFLAGIATGLAMAATTSWVKELSQAPYDTAAVGTGARRASLLTAAGFWLGPVVSGLLAALAPAPEILPFLVHIALCIPLIVVVRALPETHDHPSAARVVTATDEELALARARFSKVVAPAAPWVFGAGTIGFAVVPAYLTANGANRLLYSTICVAVTLGFGVLIQSLARRLHDPYSARAILSGLLIVGGGVALLAGAMALNSLVLGVVASAFFGSGYGMILVAGLIETQHLSPPGQLGRYTGRYYTFAYLGFLAPTVLAFLGQWISPTWQLVLIAILLAVSLGTVLVNSRTAIEQY